jgi:hypothetical protein
MGAVKRLILEPLIEKVESEWADIWYELYPGKEMPVITLNEIIEIGQDENCEQWLIDLAHEKAKLLN